MPMLDGLGACRALRDRGDGTPVLVLTARDTVDDRVAGLDAGADDYLVKPFALRELVARMNALLRRAQPPRDVLGYADLTLDLTARTARRGDAELSFTKIEFSLLELLVRNAEQVLSYDVIIDRVWGYGEAPASNALQVFVAFLRRKLEAERPPAPGAQRARRRLRAAGRAMRIRLTLKARFILVAGGAVAAVALAITAVAFLAIRTDLQNQVRQEVAARADSVRHQARSTTGTSRTAGCRRTRRGFGILTYTQVVTRNRCRLGAAGRPAAAHAERGRHRGGGRARQDSFYSSARINGIRAMVLTEQIAPGLAIQVAEPLTATDQEVATHRRDAGACSAWSACSRPPCSAGRWPGPGSRPWPGWPAWPRRSR